MIQKLKSILQKKTVFIITFLSAFFIAPIFARAGISIPPIYDVPFKEDFISANAFIGSEFEVEYNELMQYYKNNLSSYYDSYIIVSYGSYNGLATPTLFYFNEVDVPEEPFVLQHFNHHTRHFQFRFKLQTLNNYLLRKRHNEHGVIEDSNLNYRYGGIGEVVVDFIPPIGTSFTNFTFLLETNVDRQLIYKVNMFNTINVGGKFINDNEIIYNSLSDVTTKGNTYEYIFDVDGDIWKNGKYQGLNFYFKKPENEEINFKIELIENEESKPSFDFIPAFDLSFLNLADTLEKIKQCEFNSDGFGGCFTGLGGSFGGGGGGGRFGDDDDYCNVATYPLEIEKDMISEYGVFTILPCEIHKGKQPNYFKTEQIKITTNVEVFMTYKELEEEFMTNPPEWFDWGNESNNTIKSPTDLFKIINQFMVDNRYLIKEISNMTNNLFGQLNPSIRSFIISIYSMLVVAATAILIRR